MDNYYDNRKYDNGDLDRYYDKNYINNKNRYNDNYNDKDIKDQFIQNVLDCIFENIPRVYIVWRDDTNGNEDIFFRANNNGGQTFGSTINLSDNNGLSDDPQIAASGDNVYVVWRDTTNGNDRDIFFRASNNGGQTFGSTINLSDTDDTSNFADIAVSRDNVYVVWVEETEPPNFDTFFRASNNGGQTFGSTINLSNSASVDGEPEILVSRHNVYVVWIDRSNDGDEDIFFRASTDRGKTFEDIIDLSDNDEDSFDPQMLTSGNNVYVLWIDTSNGSDRDIFFRASTDAGKTFEDTIDLSDNDGSSDDPQIAASRDKVYVAWRDNSNSGDTDIFFRASNNNGQIFNSVIDLSNNGGNAGEPVMLVE